MQNDVFINLIPRIVSSKNKYADVFNSDKSIVSNKTSLNSIYVVGANFYSKSQIIVREYGVTPIR